MSLLQEVQYAVEDLQAAVELRKNLAVALSQAKRGVQEAQASLDGAMVAAVDEAGHLPSEVAAVAGYVHHSIIRDARKRIDKREAGVR